MLETSLLPWILFAVSFLLLCVSLYYNYRFATTILRVEDAVTLSLDELDERYYNLSEILQIPVFYDSPQVRQVMDDIRKSRDSVLYVANQLAKVEIDGQEEKDT